MHSQLVSQLTGDRKKQSLVVQRRAVLQVLGALGCMLAVLVGSFVFAGWEIHILHSAQAAERQAAARAAHQSSVALVRAVMEIQSELDMQEDHDRTTLQLYLKLERETLPQLHKDISLASAGCPQKKEIERKLSEFGVETNRHADMMLAKLQSSGAKARRRAQALAHQISAIVRADRARQRASGGHGWSDADLEAPLRALRRRLERPNATFELEEATIAEWCVQGRERLARSGDVCEEKRHGSGIGCGSRMVERVRVRMRVRMGLRMRVGRGEEREEGGGLGLVSERCTAVTTSFTW